MKKITILLRVTGFVALMFRDYLSVKGDIIAAHGMP